MRNWKVRLLHRRCTDFKIFKEPGSSVWLYSRSESIGGLVAVEVPRIPRPWKWNFWTVPDEEFGKYLKESKAHWEEQKKLFPKKGDLVELEWNGRKVRGVIVSERGEWIISDHEWLPYNQHRPIHVWVYFRFSEFIQKAIIHGNYRNKVKKDGEEVKQ